MELPNSIHLKKWEEVLSKIFSSPDELHLWDKGGFLPIHNACFEENVPLNVIEALIKAYPNSLNQKSQMNGLLPLHCAVHHYTSTNSEIVKFLLKKYKEGAAEKEENGRTPLIYHLLVSQSPSLQMTRMLVDAQPDAVRIRDDRKWSPLHYAAYRGNWEISQYLIEINPDSLMEKNIDNKTPREITICNGRHQMAEKFREAEEDIKSGMMKITEHREQCDSTIENDNIKINPDFLNNEVVDSLYMDSISSTVGEENAFNDKNTKEKNIIQDEFSQQDKDYSYCRSMHDRLVYDWN